MYRYHFSMREFNFLYVIHSHNKKDQKTSSKIWNKDIYMGFDHK